MTLVQRQNISFQGVSLDASPKSASGYQYALKKNGTQFFSVFARGDMSEWEWHVENQRRRNGLYYRDRQLRPVSTSLELRVTTDDSMEGERLVRMFVRDVWPKCRRQWQGKVQE